jgi:CRP/FNR family transcriptional regulator
MGSESSIYSGTWEEIFANAPSRNFERNTVIINEGDPIDRVYFVKSGRIVFSIVTPGGHEKIMYALNKGGVFGDVWAQSGRPYFLTATTFSKTTLAWLSPQEFLARVVARPGALEEWLSYISEIVEYLVEHITDITYLDREGLLRKYLYRLSFNYGLQTADGIKINTKITHQFLADLIGASRVTISKIMLKLVDEGLIARRDGFFYILDLDRLGSFQEGNCEE